MMVITEPRATRIASPAITIRTSMPGEGGSGTTLKQATLVAQNSNRPGVVIRGD